MRAMAAPASLSVAIVTHAPDMRLLARTLASLADAAAHAFEGELLAAAHLIVVDNGPEGNARDLELLARAALDRAPCMTFEVISGQGNVGFARANNLALARAGAELHLVLNPDVEMDRESLAAALRHLAENADVGAITPAVRDATGRRQYLVKAYPGAGVLFVRAFVPRFLHALFRKSLYAYELRERDWSREQSPVELASGCFLLCRRAPLDAVGGFDPGFFLYFEDFDLTLRLAATTKIAYCPQVRIVHHGGDAASKGLRHVAWFVRSGVRFFSKHGWNRPH